MYPRHRKHGGENGTALGGRVSLEPATKNLVEVCRIAERAVLDGAALSVSAINWNGMRNSERRIGLGIDPGMLGYRISPRCWTAHGRHWLPSSTQLNIKIQPKLSNTSNSSNGGTGSRRGSVRLSWDMVSSPCLNWKLRSDTERFLSRPIWISRWWLTTPSRQYEFWKSNPL